MFLQRGTYKYDRELQRTVYLCIRAHVDTKYVAENCCPKSSVFTRRRKNNLPRFAIRWNTWKSPPLVTRKAERQERTHFTAGCRPLLLCCLYRMSKHRNCPGRSQERCGRDVPCSGVHAHVTRHCSLTSLDMQTARGLTALSAG